MARFTDRFLEEVRAALPVSTLAQRHVKSLKKAGKEWKGLSPFQPENTPSFTVNDKKEMWFDFSSGRNGNVFQLEMECTGCSFEEAVERCASLAGMQAPPKRARHENGHANGVDSRPVPPDMPVAGSGDRPREVVETYDYCGPDGEVRYQVCRVEWVEGGKRKKSFQQRQPVDEHPGEWAWGLKEAEFVRGRSGDWYEATSDRADWQGPRVFLPGCAHMLYRLPELREELAQDDPRVVFLPEGERKVLAHERWNMVATCASGGARHWLPNHAAELLGADVVIEADNDEAGREGAEKKALSLRGIAKRVRVLDWGRVWRDCPLKGDVVDYERAGHTGDDLWALVDQLPTWAPSVPDSKFSALRFVDIDRPGRELQWLVKSVLTRGEVSIWYGPPGCGKSYLILDLAMSVARGVAWMGQRVRNGLVCYQAGEGGLGLKKRLRAYRKHYGLRADDNVPFVLMTSRINLYEGDKDAEALIAELHAWRAYYDTAIELVVIDTLSAASPASNENASEDVTRILERCRRVSAEFGCSVAIVHHTPKVGNSPRGHSALMGNVDNAVEVILTEQINRQRDGDREIMRAVREMVVRKQKDDADGFLRSFILKQVIVGIDPDDDKPITACIVEAVGEQRETAGAREAPLGWATMKPNNQTLLRALQKAIDLKGAVPPPGTEGVPEYTRCCRVGDWIAVLCELKYTADPADPPTDRYRHGVKLYNRCRIAVGRSYGEYGWVEKNFIGKANEFVWRTSRRVVGVDEAPATFARRPEADMLAAPGEDQDDMSEVFK